MWRYGKRKRGKDSKAWSGFIYRDVRWREVGKGRKEHGAGGGRGREREGRTAFKQ